jgi:flagellar hook-length control protein FliK
MSLISPVALAILNTLQAGSKGDGNAEDGDAFLSFLDSRTGNAGNSLTSESEQSLVDTLYQDKPQPVAAPAQVPTSVFAENKYPANNTPPAAERREYNQADDAPAAKASSAPENDNTPTKNTPVQARENDTQKNVASQQSGKLSGAAKTQAANTGGDRGTDVDAIAEKIRAKIGQLSDILSLLASVLGANANAQVSVVQVTQTTLTVSQQGLQSGQPFVDLSGRFEQLIAALSAPGQNLPSGVQESLSQTFGDFRSLIASFAATDGGAEENAGLLSLLPDNSAPKSGDSLLTQLASLETNLSSALQDLLNVDADILDKAVLADALKQLNKWLGDVKTVAQAPKHSADLETQVIADDDAGAINTARLQAAAQTQKPVAQAGRNNNNIEIQAQGTGAASVVAASAGAPVPVQSPANSGAANTVVAANVAENIKSGNNSSFSNSNSGGQGGERPAAPTVNNIAGTNAAAATASTVSFGKTLKAVSAPASAPVAEQVAFNIKTAVKNGDSKIEIQLDPVELGKLHIKMNVSGDGKATNVVITADNKATLDMLQRDARGLENALADAGIKTDSGSLSFNLRGGDQQQQEDRRQAFAGYAPLTQPEDELAPLAVVSRSYTVNATDGLDIQI